MADTVGVAETMDMATSSRPRIAELARGAVAPAVLVLLWALVSTAGVINGPMAVSPWQVLMAPITDASGRELWAALLATLARVAAGSIPGALIGVAVGMVLGLSRRAALVFAPTVHTVRQIALFAWIPLLTAWFGNGELSKIVFIGLSTFFPVFLAAEQGVRHVSRALIEVADTLRLSRGRRLRSLYLPAALPSIYTGLQVAVLSAWIGTVGAEYAIGSGRGLGCYLASARDQFRMDIVIAGVIALAVGGVALHRLSGYLAARASAAIMH